MPFGLFSGAMWGRSGQSREMSPPIAFTPGYVAFLLLPALQPFLCLFEFLRNRVLDFVQRHIF